MKGALVWIVGKDVIDTWEFAGVFADEQDAIEASVSEEYFIGPAIIGEGLPDDSVEWEGLYYPMLETEQ